MKHLITTHTRAILLMALMMLLPSALWAQKEAYAEYDDGTLTFHYDEDRASYNETYSMFTSGDRPAWTTHSLDIRKVIFNEDFKDVRPKSCKNWFNGMKDLTYISGLEYLGTDSVTDMSQMFYQCNSLTSLDMSHFKTDCVTTMTKMFGCCFSLTELDLSTFNTHQVDNMSDMFYNCGNLIELNLSSFDTQKVTDMSWMFGGDASLVDIYASDLFVTDHVTRSEYMFFQCQKLPNFDKNYTDKTKTPEYLTFTSAQPWVEYQDTTKTLIFHNDNTRKAATAIGKYDLPAAGVDPEWIAHYEGITKAVFCGAFKDVRPERCAKWFYGMSNLTEIQGMEYLCTDSVNDMSQMFYQCKALNSLDLSHFNTERVTTMTGMFHYCFALTQLDLSTFSTEKVDNMSYMFGFCNQLTELDLSTFDTQTVNKMEGMFVGDAALTCIYVSGSFALDQVTQSTSMFKYCEKLPSFDSNYTDKTKAPIYLTYIQPWAEYQADTKTLTFHNDRSQAAVTATAQYDLPAAGADPGWLEYKGDITTVVFKDHFKNARPVRCAKWFADMKNLTDIQGMEYLCTDSVNDMSRMFYYCTNLPSIDLSHFNTEHVTTMINMFSNCKSLTELDVTSFNTAKVDDMSSMFSNCAGLTELDLTSFDTRKVKDMSSMFFRDAVNHIYVTDLFVTDQVEKSDYMFSYCENLPNYQSIYDKTYAHYKEDEGGYLTLRRHFSVGEARYNVDGYTTPTCYTDVTFTDGSEYSASCDFTFSSDNTASYTRTTSNHWATLCLPFAFSADDNSTARFYSVGSYDNGNITATPISGIIAAGTPVLAYVTDGELSITATAAAAVAEAKQQSSLNGAFAQTEVKDDEYIIANDHFWNAAWLKQNNDAVKNVYVAPYRASLTLTSTEAKPNSISIDLGETDGIDSIDTTDPPAFLEGAELYDLQGRRLTAPISGMMIIRKDGVSRKVVVKGSQVPQGL